MAILTKLRVQPDDEIRWSYTAGASPEQLARSFGLDLAEIDSILSRECWPGRLLAELIREDAIKLTKGSHVMEARELYNGRTSQQELADGYGVSVRAIWWAADAPHWDDPGSCTNWDEVVSWFEQ